MSRKKVKPVLHPPWVFYSAPYVMRGRWMRSEMATAVVDCTVCKSKKWEPCKSTSTGAYIASTHWQRRRDAKDKIVTTCSGCGK